MTRSHGASERFHWCVTVMDPAGRERDVLIGVRAGLVVTLVPPGEGFTQTPEGARELAAHYTAAAKVAEMDNRTTTSSRPPAHPTLAPPSPKVR